MAINIRQNHHSNKHKITTEMQNNKKEMPGTEMSQKRTNVWCKSGSLLFIEGLGAFYVSASIVHNTSL